MPYWDLIEPVTIKIIRPLDHFVKKTRTMIILSGVAVTLLVAIGYIFTPPYLHLLDLKLYDAIFQKVKKNAAPANVVIVDIDDNSLDEFGQWPWPRYRLALLIRKIHQAGAKAVGIDILFAEQDGSSPSVLKKALKKDLHIDVTFTGFPEGLMDNDIVLSNVLKMNMNVLGFSAKYKRQEEASFDLPDIKEIEIREEGAKSALHYLPEVNGIIPPLSVLTEGVKNVGFMNTLSDADGVMRKVPLFITCQGKIYPQLALATLMAAFEPLGVTPAIKVNRSGIESVRIAGHSIQVDMNGHMMLNYRGPKFTFPYISAKSIFEDKIEAEALKNKIVILGTSAEGLKDIRISPLDPFFPGVEIHATIIDNIINKNYFHRPDYTPGLEFVLILVLGMAVTCLIAFSNAFFTLIALTGLSIGTWYGSLLALENFRMWVSPFFPALGLILNFSILNMEKFWLAEKRKKFFKRAFSKYVSKAVVDQLSENPDKLSLDGDEKPVSILFSDIRSFTSISERMTPTQVTKLLHDYFTPITKIIITHGGTHDKFIGDAVMCFWNAPLDVKKHENCAIKAALEMIDSLEEINMGFEERFGVKIAVGIGLHAGTCRVGNMGSDDIFDYTIIGDNVNLASRLEGLTKFYGVALILSDTMLKGITDDMIVQELDIVRVKGKKEPIGIHTVYPVGKKSTPGPDELHLYNQALTAYKKKAFEQAQTIFRRLSSDFPDKKIYDLYHERCSIFIETPPPDDWDGVFTHVSK